MKAPLLVLQLLAHAGAAPQQLRACALACASHLLCASNLLCAAALYEALPAPSTLHQSARETGRRRMPTATRTPASRFLPPPSRSVRLCA
jgi:hypothetical protein